MITNIAYFPSQCGRNGGPVLDAFLDSCRTSNIIPIENSMSADAAVIWSVLWSGRMAANQQVYEHYRSHHRPVLVIDVGALHRGHTWKIAVNNINGLGHYGHQQNLDWDRPKKLHMNLTNTCPTDPAVLICLQHQNSLQVQAVDIQQWLAQQITDIKQHTDRPIKIRPHPRGQIPLQLPPLVTVQTPRKIAHTYDSFDLEFDCQAIVNFNSGPGIQAGIAGCPVIVDSSSLAHPITITIQDIDQRPLVDRDQWFVEICHTEYTLTEIKQAQWVKRIGQYL